MVSATLVLMALAPGAAAQSARFLHLGVDEGLAHGTVWAVQQDAQGYLWVGTEAGLQRFDGYRFTTYLHDPDDPTSLSGSEVMVMTVDRRGDLWLGTRQQGLNRYDSVSNRFIRYVGPESPASGPAPTVLASVLFEDSAGTLWIGTSEGLYTLDADRSRFSRWPTGEDDDPLAGNVIDLAEAPEGVLWAGTADGLVRLTVESGETEVLRDWLGPESEPNAEVVIALTVDEQGRLWQGTGTGEVWRRPVVESWSAAPDTTAPSTVPWAVEPTPAMHLGGSIQDLALWEGGLWAAAYGGGTGRLDLEQGTVEVFDHDPTNPSSLASARVLNLTTDRTGSLWVGTRGGLHQLHRERQRFQVWGHQGQDAPLGGSVVLGLEEDRDGTLWLSGDGWLRRIDPQTGVSTTLPLETLEGAPVGQVEEILEDPQGRLWFGSNEGVFYRDPTDTGLRPFVPMAGKPVRTLIESADGTLWAGGGEGIDRIDPQTGTLVGSRATEDSVVYTLLEDRAGALWAGLGVGLDRFAPHGGAAVRYRFDPENPDGLGDASVGALLEDRKGRIWVAQVGAGLALYQPEGDHFVHYTVKSGLPHDNVVSLLEDASGHLWAGTHGGLARFDPEEERFQAFDRGDGLVSNAFLIGPSLVTRDGLLMLGGAGGVNRFDPRVFDAAQGEVPVVITGLTLDGDAVALPPEAALELTHLQKAVGFDFAALDFANPAKIRYRHRLRGYDDWSEIDARHRRARYTNLDPGTYEFEVQATTTEGTWGAVAARRRVQVYPSPWRSGWAFALYASGIFLLVSAYVRSQRRKLRRQQETAEREREMAERERAVSRRLRAVDKLKDEFLANTSHELRTPLYGITGLAESLLSGAGGDLPRAAEENLELIVASGRRLGHLVDDILDFSKMRHESLQLTHQPVDLRPLVEVVLTLTRPLLGEKPLELVNQVPADLSLVLADENRLLQILHNLVGNAVKFTPSGTVVVGAIERGDRLELWVSDTGPGIPEAERERIFEAFTQAEGAADRMARGTGLGLAVTRQLVELHRGTLAVRTAAGGGAELYFDLPVAQEATRGEVSGAIPGQDSGSLRARDWRKDPRAEGSGARRVGVGRLGGPEGPASEGDGDLPGRILVVDDEPINRRILAQHLESDGHRVATAADGPEALERLGDTGLDLVLLDVMMPRMSGYEVCRKIRAQHSLDELPVLFLTAKSQPTDLVAGLSAGANDYLPKPISKTELLARVKTHLALLRVHRELNEVLEQRTEQVEERTRLLREREALIDELEAKHTELARFNYTVSHDLRNPLVTIRNFLGSLRSGLEGGQNERFEEDLSRLDRAADDMQRLLEDLDKFSRAGRPDNTLQPIALDGVIEVVRRDLGVSLAERDAVLEVSPQLPIVLGDRQRLIEVFRQLLDNALHFAGPDRAPRVEIGARPMVVDPEARSQEVVVTVRDEGVGIDASYHERVFNLFERLDPDGSPGTGVGLALVRRIIETLGGRIWVESDGEGQGSTFCLGLRSAIVQTPEASSTRPRDTGVPEAGKRPG